MLIEDAPVHFDVLILEVSLLRVVQVSRLALLANDAHDLVIRNRILQLLGGIYDSKSFLLP